MKKRQMEKILADMVESGFTVDMPVYCITLELRLNLRSLSGPLLLLLALTVFAASARGAGGGSAEARTNSPEQMDKPHLLLISIDGFRWDFAELVETPALDRIAARGLKAEALQPVFPTLTFPNHYSIATGVRPSRHGIVANRFPHESGDYWYHYKDRDTVQDGRWYQREPIWVTAEKHGMLSAAYYFVGTEADVAGIRPSHWHAFDAEVSGEDRVAQVLDWLSAPPETRPHMVTLYFEDVDDNAHWHGPVSPESREAIGRVDAQIQTLLDGLEDMEIADSLYIILLSDHGQGAYAPDQETLVLDQLISLEGTQVVEGGTYVFIHLDRPDPARAEHLRDSINGQWDCGRAMLPWEAPAAWNVEGSARHPDLLVMADPGCAVLSTVEKEGKATPGDHGWPPEMPEMKGIFYAMGPRIPAGTRIGVIGVTDVYPLMMAILDLPYPHSIDGDPDRLPSLLLPAR